MKLDWKQIVVSLAIGVLVGSMFSSMKCKWCPCKMEGKKEKMVERMSKKLNLTSEQKTQATTIMEDKINRMKELHNAKKTEMRAILTPEQQSKFDEITAKWEAKRKY